MPHETSVLLQGDRPVMENVNKWRQVVLPGLPMYAVTDMLSELQGSRT